jgi:hypothetical protein
MGNPRAPSAPSELKDAGKRLWKAIFAGFSTDDPRETHAVRQACRLEDDIVRLRVELDDAPLVTKGSTGQPVESPLLGSVRNAVALQSKLLAGIGIDDGVTASTAGRRLVSHRYN